MFYDAVEIHIALNFCSSLLAKKYLGVALMAKLRLVALVCSSLFLNGISNANDVSQVGRYLTILNKPTLSQARLLSQIVQIRFPLNVQTVGDAMNYLLQFSGYSLVSQEQMNKALKTIISKPLPMVHRQLGPISLKEGLIVLAGPAFYLISDPVNRVVDLRLKPSCKQGFL